MVFVLDALLVSYTTSFFLIAKHGTLYITERKAIFVLDHHCQITQDLKTHDTCK